MAGVCVPYLQKLNHVLTVNTGEKSPHASSRGGEKGVIQKYILLNMACPQLKLFYQSLTCLDLGRA